MGLEKFIVKQVVNVAKDTNKIQASLDVMSDKLVEESLKVVDDSGINPALLSFDIVGLAKGEVEPDESNLTPEVLCSFPPLSSAQKVRGQNSLNNLKAAVTNTLDNINSLKQALVTIQKPLQALEITAKNLDTIITAVKVGVKVIKLIPIPTSVPPGIGIPLNIITILSDVLDQLDKLLTLAKGITTAVPILINSIIGLITQVILGVDGIVAKLTPILSLLAFVQSKIDLGDSCPNAGGEPLDSENGISQGDIDQIQSAVTAEIQAAILELGDSSIATININNEQSLIESLQPNSQNPIIYKRFVLTLQNDPKNKFDFASRRIMGTRNFSDPSDTSTFFLKGNAKTNKPLKGNIVLYNDPQQRARYSFSSSVQVLVEEMEYAIDQYVLGLSEAIVQKVKEEIAIAVSTAGGTRPTPLNPSGSGTTTILPPFTLVGANSVSTSRRSAAGTITTTVPNVEVTLKTFGGSGTSVLNSLLNSSNAVLVIKQAPKAGQNAAAFASNGKTTIAAPIVLAATGIYTYTLVLSTPSNSNRSGNTASFEINSYSIPGTVLRPNATGPAYTLNGPNSVVPGTIGILPGIGGGRGIKIPNKVFGSIVVKRPIKLIFRVDGGNIGGGVFQKFPFTSANVILQKGSTVKRIDSGLISGIIGGGTRVFPPEVLSVGTWNYSLELVSFKGKGGNKASFSIFPL